jgi:amino-acid N-acetyltransferase
MIVIEHARPSDRPEIELLLQAGGLPTAGLELAMPTACVARENRRIVGCAAVETYGSVGLLRSVCVEEAHRGTGLGCCLVEHAEAVAADRGVAELFLLTETAAGWFPRFGYEPCARDAAPAELLVSPEFTGACPVGAELFRKHLDRALTTVAVRAASTD